MRTQPLQRCFGDGAGKSPSNEMAPDLALSARAVAQKLKRRLERVFGRTARLGLGTVPFQCLTSLWTLLCFALLLLFRSGRLCFGAFEPQLFHGFGDDLISRSGMLPEKILSRFTPLANSFTSK